MNLEYFFKNKNFSYRRRKFNKNNIEILNNYWPIFGTNFKIFNDNNTKKKDQYLFYLSNLFYKKNNILEIGFGSGESLIKQSFCYKYSNILGIEIYIPGIISCIKKIFLKNINNVFIIYGDAVKILQNYFINKLFLKINIFFPDPWPKNKHKKRRMINFNFLKLIYKKLIYKGELNIVTDCKNYFLEIKKILQQKKNFFFKENIYFKKENFFLNTRFFLKAKKKKKIIYYLNYKKNFF